MDQAKDLLEMPREFLKDGRGFLTRCSKRTSTTSYFPYTTLSFSRPTIT